jgi:hypothetical protein
MSIIEHGSLVNSVVMREAMLLGLQMVDELVLSRKASARDTARAAIKVALEAGGCSVSVGNVSCQVTFAGVVLEAALVGAMVAFIVGAKVDAWTMMLARRLERRLECGLERRLVRRLVRW